MDLWGFEQFWNFQRAQALLYLKECNHTTGIFWLRSALDPEPRRRLTMMGAVCRQRPASALRWNSQPPSRRGKRVDHFRIRSPAANNLQKL